jgi:hypothetical protein
MVTLGGRHGDKPPGDAGGFLTFAQQLRTPTLYKAIGHAKRLGDVVRFGFSASVWWHFERLKTRSHRLTPKLFGTRRHQPFLMIVDPADRGLSGSVCLDPAREPAATAHAAKDDSARRARL